MKTTLSDDYPPTGQEYWYFDNIRECHEEGEFIGRIDQFKIENAYRKIQFDANLNS